MISKEILVLFAVCAILSVAYSSPVDSVIHNNTETTDISFPTTSQRPRRDVFPENPIDHHLNYTKDNLELTEDKNDQKNVALSTADIKSDGNIGNVDSSLPRVVENANGRIEEHKETLRLAADTAYPIVYRVRRQYDGGRRYYRHNYYYDDRDYAGYNRKGALVGYQSPDDDFPTVVW